SALAARRAQGRRRDRRMAEGARAERRAQEVVRAFAGTLGRVPYALPCRARTKPGRARAADRALPGRARHARVRRARRGPQQRRGPEGVSRAQVGVAARYLRAAIGATIRGPQPRARTARISEA